MHKLKVTFKEKEVIH